jgi:hypothetical protein
MLFLFTLFRLSKAHEPLEYQRSSTCGRGLQLFRRLERFARLIERANVHRCDAKVQPRLGAVSIERYRVNGIRKGFRREVYFEKGSRPEQQKRNILWVLPERFVAHFEALVIILLVERELREFERGGHVSAKCASAAREVEWGKVQLQVAFDTKKQSLAITQCPNIFLLRFADDDDRRLIQSATRFHAGRCLRSRYHPCRFASS